jgi:tRNA nucleotidyltransferase (CCA-adding enzyme)
MLLTKLHLRPIALAKKNISDKAIRRLMFESGDYIDDLMILCRADITTKNKDKVKKYLKNFERVEKLMEDVTLRDEMKAFKSPVDGRIIMKTFNIKEGNVIGLIKDDIENAILDEKIDNEYDAAFNYMMEIKNKYL